LYTDADSVERSEVKVIASSSKKRFFGCEESGSGAELREIFLGIRTSRNGTTPPGSSTVTVHNDQRPPVHPRFPIEQLLDPRSEQMKQQKIFLRGKRFIRKKGLANIIR
jgi:hypothetical protein